MPHFSLFVSIPAIKSHTHIQHTHACTQHNTYTVTELCVCVYVCTKIIKDKEVIKEWSIWGVGGKKVKGKII